MLVYAWKVKGIEKAIFWPSRNAFKEWKAFLKVAVPGMAMLCAEWWYFELISILAGYVGVEDQAIMVILINIGIFM